MRSIQDGNEVVEYLLESVTSAASGLYSCGAENIFGGAESSVRIDVEGRPFIREMSSPRRLLSSLHEWLHCSYGGFPIDKVTWDKDGKYFLALFLSFVYIFGFPALFEFTTEKT